MKITLTQFRPNTAEAVWTDCFAQAIAELHKAGGGVLTVPTGEYSTWFLVVAPLKQSLSFAAIWSCTWNRARSSAF